jgi:Cytochrome c554 and c-prime
MESGPQLTRSDAMTCRCTAMLLCLLFAIGCTDKAANVKPSATTASAARQPAVRESWPRDNRRDDRFVGSTACADCHREIHDEYFATHPMGRSVRLVADLEGPAADSLPTTISHAAIEYQAYRKGDALWQAESATDSEGIIYRQDVEIDFAVGSGARGYTFVSVRDGCLFQAPLTWYTKTLVWDLSPGYDAVSNPRFERRISTGCIACHSGRANTVPGEQNRFEEPLFAEALIGCERCHGPGAHHLEFHMETMPDGPKVDPIINPAGLDHALRDSVCYQCHLHGQHRVLRSGRNAFDFRPGDHVSDIWVTFLDDKPVTVQDGGSRAVSQPEQMMASTCYRKSNGELGCISCHDPHRVPATADRVDYFRQGCLNCHEDGQTVCSIPEATRRESFADDSCIECHMPRLRADDVPHTAQTNHMIPRHGHDPWLSAAKLPRVFGQGDGRLSKLAIQRAEGLMISDLNGSPDAASYGLHQLDPWLKSTNDPEVFAAAAWLAIALRDMNAALRFARDGLAISPHNEEALEAAALAAQVMGQVDVALRYTEKLRNLDPWNSTYGARHALLLEAAGDPSAAIVIAQETLSINPLLVATRSQLARMLDAEGFADEGASEQHMYERLVQFLKSRKAPARSGGSGR